VFLTQHYETGQYALESIPMSAEVYNLISRLSDGREDDEEGGSEESNERRFA
jgi:hypothetical protein